MKRKSTTSGASRKQSVSKITRDMSGQLSFKERLSQFKDDETYEESEGSSTSNKRALIKTPKKNSRSKHSKSKSKSKSHSSAKKSKSKEKSRKHSIQEQEPETEENSNQFNTQLQDIVQSFSVMNNNSKNNSINNKKNLLSQYEKFEKFPFDHSLSKEVDVEIILEAKNGKKIDKEELIQVAKKITDALNIFFKKCPFNYYEFSNPKARVSYINSSIDNINYDHLYEKHANVNLNSIEVQNKALAVIKDINYISAFSSVYKRFIRGEVMNDNFENYNPTHPDNFFYLVTPLVSFYFFKYEDNDFFRSSRQDIDDSGAIISNSHRVLEKNLKDYGVKYSKIEMKKKDANGNVIGTQSSGKKSKNNSNKKINLQKTIPLYSIQNNTSEVEVMNNFITDSLSTQNSDSLIYIKNYHYSLLFNMILNEYEESSMNIFSPFAFDNSTLHHCKVLTEPFTKPENSSLTVNLKILGCVFNLYLTKLIKFLSGVDVIEEIGCLSEVLRKESKYMDFSFNLKFHPFMKTSSFYNIHRKLSGAVDKVFFKDKAFHVKMQNY
jgi:hypothetical protein